MKFEYSFKKIALIGCWGSLIAGSLYAGVLGPLTLFSLPKGIKGLIAAREFAQIKQELITLLPSFLIMFALLVSALIFIFCVYCISRCYAVHRFYARRRMRRYGALLQGLLLDLKLGRDLTSSPLIEEVKKMSHSWFMRGRFQKENFNGMQVCLDRICNSELSREERGEFVNYLIRMFDVVNKK